MSDIQIMDESVNMTLLKQRHIWPCVYHFYRNAPVIVRGLGAHLWDRAGQRYLDCYSGVGVMSAGHSNPFILAAVLEQAESLCHTTTIYLTEPMLLLSERLAKLLPGELGSFFFCASGSEANEAALHLASLATGRGDFISFANGLHGRTKAAMSATALPMWRTDSRLLECFHHAPKPTNPDSLCAVKRLLKKHEVAAVLIEPVQGNGGIHVAPDGFLMSLKELCNQHGALLIADEVQTGVNRTGTFLACEGMGVVPDIVTMAKALGNGLPIAVAATTPKLASAYHRPGASTYGGNPISAAAAIAALEFHIENDLGGRSAELGAWLLELLNHKLQKIPLVADIRGRGLMVGIEIQKGNSEDTAVCVTEILEELKDVGFLVGRTGEGRNVLTIMPPLIVNKSDLILLVDALTSILEQAV